jgi:hypothetical protein
VLAACSPNGNDASPPTTTTATTAAPTLPVTSQPRATVAAPRTTATIPLTRPLIELDECQSTWARQLPAGMLDNLFARRSSAPYSIQVFGDPANPYGAPFAVVERFFADQRLTGSEYRAPPGRTIFNHRSGRSSAEWLLADGSEAYLNTRDLPDETVVALAAALQPRPADAWIPGFDLPVPPARLELLDEAVSAIDMPERALSGCVVGSRLAVTVLVVGGRPLARFAALIDRPSPLPLARQLDDGRTMIAAGNPGTDPGRALDAVRQATQAEWAALLAAPSPFDPPPTNGSG